MILIGLSFLLGLAFSLGMAAFAQAGVADWFSPSSTDAPPPQKPRTVKKAGLKPMTPKKKSAGSRLIDNLTTSPKEFAANTKSLFKTDAPPTTHAKKTVPRKMVADKQQKPSLIKRLFTPQKQPEPRTVNEWMSQKRPS
jgi:hypothetical protein